VQFVDGFQDFLLCVEDLADQVVADKEASLINEVCAFNILILSAAEFDNLLDLMPPNYFSFAVHHFF